MTSSVFLLTGFGILYSSKQELNDTCFVSLSTGFSNNYIISSSSSSKQELNRSSCQSNPSNAIPPTLDFPPLRSSHDGARAIMQVNLTSLSLSSAESRSYQRRPCCPCRICIRAHFRLGPLSLSLRWLIWRSSDVMRWPVEEKMTSAQITSWQFCLWKHWPDCISVVICCAGLLTVS